MLSIHRGYSCLLLILLCCSKLAAQGQCAAGEMGQIVSAQDGSANSWTDCTGEMRQVYKFPSTVKVFPYIRPLLTQRYGGYSTTAKKMDIVWIANTIDINEPLRSFGGDIILFADTLNIKAPIDSRVYVEHDVDYFESGAPDYIDEGRRRRRERTDNAHRENGEVYGIDANLRYAAAYRDYYLHSFERVDNETRLPELPSGLAAATSFGAGSPNLLRFDGEPAPDNIIVFPEARSGSIYIFANTIHVDGFAASFEGAVPRVRPTIEEFPYIDLGRRARMRVDPRPGLPDYRNECSENQTKVVPFLINAGGLNGGRGGAGSSAMCTSTGFVCHPDYLAMTGGFSGPGGKGGDAGNVYINLIGATHSEELAKLKFLLASISNVKGGAPGSNLKYQTPSATGAFATTDSRCSFRALGDDNAYEEAPRGQDGKVEISEVNSTESIQLLSRYLIGKDLRFDYDAYTILNLSRTDRTIHSLRPSAALSDYLGRSLVQAEVKFTNDFQRFVAGEPEQGAYLPKALSGMSCSVLHRDVFVDQQVTFLQHLCYFDSTDGISTVIENLDGLFDVPTKNMSVQRMSSGQLRVEIAEVKRKLDEVKDDLRALNSQVFKQITGEQKKSLMERIIAVQVEIAHAEKNAADEAKKETSLVPLVGALKKIGEDVAAFVSAMQNGSYAEVTNTLKDVIDGFQDLASMSQVTHFPTGLATLKLQLDTLEKEYDSLARYFDEQKHTYFSREFQDLQDYLRSLEAVQSKLFAECFLFPDLLKVAAISYYSGSARNLQTLNLNLDGLRTYLQDFPTQEPITRISDIQWECDKGAKCLPIPPDDKNTREVFAMIQIGKTTKKIALYKLAPSSAELAKPIFLLDPKSISIEVVKPSEGVLPVGAADTP
jgi:hypothetical protein